MLINIIVVSVSDKPQLSRDILFQFRNKNESKPALSNVKHDCNLNGEISTITTTTIFHRQAPLAL